MIPGWVLCFLPTTRRLFMAIRRIRVAAGLVLSGIASAATPTVDREYSAEVPVSGPVAGLSIAAGDPFVIRLATLPYSMSPAEQFVAKDMDINVWEGLLDKDSVTFQLVSASFEYSEHLASPRPAVPGFLSSCPASKPKRENPKRKTQCLWHSYLQEGSWGVGILQMTTEVISGWKDDYGCARYPDMECDPVFSEHPDKIPIYLKTRQKAYLFWWPNTPEPSVDAKHGLYLGSFAAVAWDTVADHTGFWAAVVGQDDGKNTIRVVHVSL